MDALAQEIDRVRGDLRLKRAEHAAAIELAERLGREAEMIQVRLTALEEASQMRPLGRGRSSEGSGGKGRQIGAISRRWRRILVEATDAYPQGADTGDLISVVHRNGINIRERDITLRCKKYEAQDILESTPFGWRLRSETLARFRAEGLDADDDNEDVDNNDNDDETEGTAA